MTDKSCQMKFMMIYIYLYVYVCVCVCVFGKPLFYLGDILCGWDNVGGLIRHFTSHCLHATACSMRYIERVDLYYLVMANRMEAWGYNPTLLEVINCLLI